ncbi:MAG TPA: peroxiredoxin-like family protein [Terriglobales bacterium]|nr:peroxiredoxin-like family protein [Terriglobales bacterium]
MREHQQQIQQKGANLVAIGLGGADYARHFRDETKIGFPLLIDETNQVHKAAGLRKANLLHLLRADNNAARKRAKAAGHRQHQMGKDPLRIKNPFQLGGSFVFGPGNVDRFAHVSQTFGDNAPVEELLKAI